MDPNQFYKHSLATFRAAHEYEMEMHTTSGHVAAEYDLQGVNYTCQTACAASGQAVGEALELIRRGEAEAILTGGSHSMIHPFGVTGFNLLTTLSMRNHEPARASRPFDLNRDGFVLGEGAGMVVLEELEHAKKRGATIYAELVGYGTTADAYRVTDSHPDGRGAIACIQGALKDAALKPTDIDYVNAHGTSTQVNDRAETIAIKAVCGDYAYKLPVSSSKSMLGHLICAAGVVELITCVLTIQNGAMVPTINYETPDPDCDLDYVPNQAREKKVDRCLSNSFGFGGQNVSLIVSRLAFLHDSPLCGPLSACSSSGCRSSWSSGWSGPSTGTSAGTCSGSSNGCSSRSRSSSSPAGTSTRRPRTSAFRPPTGCTSRGPTSRRRARPARASSCSGSNTGRIGGRAGRTAIRS